MKTVIHVVGARPNYINRAGHRGAAARRRISGRSSSNTDSTTNESMAGGFLKELDCRGQTATSASVRAVMRFQNRESDGPRSRKSASRTAPISWWSSATSIRRWQRPLVAAKLVDFRLRTSRRAPSKLRSDEARRDHRIGPPIGSLPACCAPSGTVTATCWKRRSSGEDSPVGNVMIDTLRRHLPVADLARIAIGCR